MSILEQISGKIIDENNQSYFVQAAGLTYEWAKEEVESHQVIGATIQAYAYKDRFGKRRLTIEENPVFFGDFVWGTVVNVRTDLGVFVDVGLDQKDIVVSLDDLPDEKHQWPKKMDELYVRLEIDAKGRYWGKLADEHDMRSLTRKAHPQLMNQNLTARVYQLKLVGAQLLTQQSYQAFIHESEWAEPLRLGQVVEARVIKVHSNGSVNLSTLPRAHEVIEDDAQMILKIMKRSPNHFLALHDKSSPQAIKDLLGLSKRQFKRAVGQLLKGKKITQVRGEGLYLVEAEGND